MTIDLWSDSRGARPHSVWVGELVSKGLAVYMRWSEHGRVKSQKTEVGTVRDGRGRIQRRRIERALDEANEKHAELKGERPKRKPRGPLTLQEGIDLAFSSRGLYPLDPKENQYTRQALAYAKDAMMYLGGPAAMWDEVTPGLVRAIWRKAFAAAGDGSGANKAEKTVTALYAIARWLEGEFPDQRFPRPIPRWRAELLDFWKKKGYEVTPDRPPYTPEEGAKLFAHREKADPRLQLGLVLGGELRGGQVIRTMRSNCDLTGERWRVQIPFVSRRKTAPRLTLSPTEHAALEHALKDGYLSDLEAAYLSGEITDYALFPGDRLKGGKAVVSRSARPLDRSSLHRLLVDLEASAGVGHMEGRAWHGLRRMFSDLYEAGVGDARVKDRLGGWSPGSEMRRKIYQQQESEILDDQAADAREHLRPKSDPDSSK